ncbi:hypothetical protein [Pseudonocardia sp.]|jgi:hypothetical protein|uniref:hypothetical protein n=1 Tax=Pseudonocardia sp. TaxID=60912 RepID=UPI0031FD8FC0
MTRCRNDGDRCWDDVDYLAGVLLGQFQLAPVVAQVVEAEDALGLGDCGVQAGDVRRRRAQSG